MRPTQFSQNASLYWVMRLYDPADGVTLIDADSLPSVAVRKNGASVADSVTVSKRAATTGIYDCSYNPSGEVYGDQFTLEETAVISGNTYSQNFEVFVNMPATTYTTSGAVTKAITANGYQQGSATVYETPKNNFGVLRPKINESVRT